MKKIFTSLCLLVISFAIHAQTISYTTAGAIYSENFDGLFATGAAITTAASGPYELIAANFTGNNVAGWYGEKYAGSGSNLGLLVGDGSANSGSLYSFGAAAASDRSLGLLASGTRTCRVGLLLTNNTASTLNAFTITFNNEMWRKGNSATANNYNFSYKTGATAINDATGFVPVSNLNLVTPNITGSTDLLRDGNNASFRASVSYTITGATWAPGQVLALRWDDLNEAGNDDALAIDDFTFSAVISSAVTLNYYNTKANLGLQSIGTWSSTLDGTGSSPVNFTDPNQYFNVVNQGNATLTGVWDVAPAGNTSKIIIGDGINPITLTVPAGPNYISSTTLADVLNNATVDFGNNIVPQLNTIATGSTVAFSQTGIAVPADIISIPAYSYYNLVLNSGLKYFSPGTTTVRGNLAANAVASMNGASSPFSTLNVFGNVNFSGASAFEPALTGDGNRLTLKMNGPGPVQQINGNGTEVKIFRLQRDSSASNTIQLGAGTTLTLGNSASGGLQLTPATTTLSLGANTINFIGAASSASAALGKISSSFGAVNILKSAGATDAGTLRFNPGTLLAQFTLNLGPLVTKDSVTIADNVTVGFVTLVRGKIVMVDGDTLSTDMMIAPTVAPYSFVDGALRVSGSTNLRFAVGKGNNFAPVGISNFGGGLNTYTIKYFNTGYGNYTIDPATLAAFPAYEVSKSLYWRVTSDNTNPYDAAFGYTDASAGINVPSQLRMANFDNTDWSDKGGLPDPASTTAGGIVYVPGLTVFGPFTFSATAAGIVPVKLKSFSVQKFSNTTKISWSTEQELNSKEFAVERSTDGGRTWTTVSTTPATGNSSVIRLYNIVDNAPFKGVNVYRLKSVDMDSKFTHSETKAVLFGNAAVVLITPNPAHSILNVYMSKSDNSISQIIISSINGKLMEKINTAEQSYQVNVSKYSKGMYVVKVISAENTSTQKVLIQ
jgi:hypothetical protein